MAMLPSMTYKPCDASSRGGTCDIIMFTQFEKGHFLSENSNNTERVDKSDDGSIMPPLLSEEEIDAMDSVNE